MLDPTTKGTPVAPTSIGTATGKITAFTKAPTNSTLIITDANAKEITPTGDDLTGLLAGDYKFTYTINPNFS